MAQRRSLTFKVTDDALYVANFGRRFDRRGIVSICRENLSAKVRRGPGMSLENIPDPKLVDAIRERRLEVYRQDPDQLQEDANHEEETRSDYAGRSLWELLQNADDALAPDGTSSADLIGAKGLGFKSVLEITDRPSIHSGPFDFGFDPDLSHRLLSEVHDAPPRLTFRLPHKIKRDETTRALLSHGYATVIRLPFRSNAARQAVVSRLETISPHFLLLCRNLDTVVIEQPGAPEIRLAVARSRASRLRHSPATLTIARGDRTEVSEWRLWSMIASAPDEDSKSLSAAIAVQVIDDLAAPSTVDIPVHVFFPTVESISAPFLIHGSFALTSNRNNIRPDKHDADVRAALVGLVRQVAKDLPAASVVRLFADIVNTAPGPRARRPERLLHQSIAEAVINLAFVSVMGGGKAKPGDVRTWEHDLDAFAPLRVASEMRLAATEMAPVFAQLRSVYHAEPLRTLDYATLLSRTQVEDAESAARAIRVAYSGCLAPPHPVSVVELLAQAPIWPTDDGRFRPLRGGVPFLDARPPEWPRWLAADALDPETGELLQAYDPAAKIRWSELLAGLLLGSRDEMLSRALAPTLRSWTPEQWEALGYQALELIEQWTTIPEFGDQAPHVDKPNDSSTRSHLVAIACVPIKGGWVASRHAYASREIGGVPELARYFKSVPGRWVVGAPAKAQSIFGPRRWKALLRYLGVSWEPKIEFAREGDGSLSGQPAYRAFHRSNNAGVVYVHEEWYIEHFPECLERLGPLHVAMCTATLVEAVATLSGKWRKQWGSSRLHAPAPFSSFADYQLRQERYLPQKSVGGERGPRLAPHELYWPGKGIAGITPVLDIGTPNRIRQAGFRPTFVGKLKVHDALTRDWRDWRIWSDGLLTRVEAGAAPPLKVVRNFYDALLRIPMRPLDTPALTRVAAVRPGPDEGIVVADSADVIWIDQGRFENPEVLNGLGLRGKTILPVRLDRGNGARSALGVCPASEVLAVEPIYEAASEASTRKLERCLTARSKALAAICRSKNLPLKALPNLVAVHDLRLKISLDGAHLADRLAPSYNEGARWLISLQAADKWEAVASAVAEPFGGHAADLKYRFARVLRARPQEIASILAEDGIPGYAIREALVGVEDDEEVVTSGKPSDEFDSPANDDEDADELGGYNPILDDDDDGLDDVTTANEYGGDRQPEKHDNGRHDTKGRTAGPRSGRIGRRKLFGSDGSGESRPRRDAADAARAALGRGLRAEAWLMEQIVACLPDWTCTANVRDDDLRETDLLLVKGDEEWHVEVKSLTHERIYWSELEREKAEASPGRYVMALLVEEPGRGYQVRWSWNPLEDLQGLRRRIEWRWHGSMEGHSVQVGWHLEPGIRWPERMADRYLHVVQVTQEALDSLDADRDGLPMLRAKLTADDPLGESRAAE